MALGLACAGCGSSGEVVAKSAIVTSDTSLRIAHLLLVSSSTGAYGGFNFDGYGDGAMRVTVPLGWTVEVTCKNASSDLAHSCAIVDLEALGPDGAPVAFPGASSPAPNSGEQPGRTVSFSFSASKLGVFRIACLVSGHEIDGMWDWFVVSRGGLPRVST